MRGIVDVAAHGIVGGEAMAGGASDLTARERAVVLALMAEARALTNRELTALGLPPLDGPARLRLNRLGVVESERVGRGYRHELTDRGWAVYGGTLEDLAPPRGGAALAAVLRAVRRYLAEADLRPADVFRPDPIAEIRRAYADVAPGPGGWVRLADLRDRIESVPRGRVDSALVAMSGSEGVHLAPEADQKALTPRDRRAAVRVGHKDVHMIAIGTP